MKCCHIDLCEINFVQDALKSLMFEENDSKQLTSKADFKMFVLSCVVILTILSVTVSDASDNQNQFLCDLPGVKRCVDKANNLTECNCTEQNDRYCPSNASCLSLGNYSVSASACWENASCSIATTWVITAVTSSTASYAINASQTTSLVLHSSVATVPTISSKPTTFYSLNTDYSPIIIAVAAGLGGFIVFVCCTCVVHSWWLRRNKFTDVNSTPLSKIEKRRRKQELLEARMRGEEEQEQGKEPSKFDMGYTKPQKVNERALANYDWARTSYLPGMLESTDHEQNPSGSIPKLICDDDDSDFHDPNELGDGNIAYEHGKEDPRVVKSPSISLSLFSSVDELESQPQEPVIVEPEIFDSLAEIPRPPPDGDMVGSKEPPPSQDYYTMMGRF